MSGRDIYLTAHFIGLAPHPEQVVQYYRASSAALALQNYNNTAIFEEEGAPDIPLPANVDVQLLNCLNATIGTSIPIQADSSALSLHNQVSSAGSLTLIVTVMVVLMKCLVQ